MKISRVSLVGAPRADQDRGLVGWITCVVDGYLALDGLALRRTADGRLTLSFPSRRDGQDRQHHFVRPLNDAARRDIEHQVFKALGLEEASRR